MSADLATTVIDAGAHYGMHPSWQAFGGDLQYFAFEPDEEEARRLGGQRRESFEVIARALGRQAGELVEAGRESSAAAPENTFVVDGNLAKQERSH